MQSKYLIYDPPSGATTSFIVGGMEIPAPSFIPEVKSREDVEALLRFPTALPKGNPIMVPANKWTTLVSHPLFRSGNYLKGIHPIGELVRNHPILFYDPPELFRYSLTNVFVSYALMANKGKVRRFNSSLRKGNEAEALDMVHPFFRPFIERQLYSLYNDLHLDIPEGMEKTTHIERAWLDPRVDEGYTLYISDIVGQAIKMPYAAIIPPVPPLLKSSERTHASRIIASNVAASVICRIMSDEGGAGTGGSPSSILPYFHLYLHWDIVEDGQGNDITTVLHLLEDGLERGDFAGVALTISGYGEAARAGKLRQLGVLVNEIVNMSHESHLPVILPRSGWYGLYMSDFEIQGFGSLLNGNEKYTKRGGGARDEYAKYGKIPLIDECRELKYREVIKYLKTHKEFPRVSGLPRRPTQEALEDAQEYRVSWAKPMRLIHAEEAKRMRNAKTRGIQTPAKMYFQRSTHPLLRNV